MTRSSVSFRLLLFKYYSDDGIKEDELYGGGGGLTRENFVYTILIRKSEGKK
jgi:hypothetical protein